MKIDRTEEGGVTVINIQGVIKLGESARQFHPREEPAIGAQRQGGRCVVEARPRFGPFEPDAREPSGREPPRVGQAHGQVVQRALRVAGVRPSRPTTWTPSSMISVMASIKA